MADGQILIDTKIDLKGAEKGVSDLKKRLDDTAKKAEKIGKNMSKYITAPLMALGGVAFAAANDLDKAYNNIAISSGAVGEDLEDLKSAFLDVFQTIPDSADTASNALANLNTLTGATGETLADLTKNVLDASRTLGEDGVANSEAFGKAMAQWQIPAQDGVRELDKLYKLTQDYGVSLGQISGHLTGYGAVLKNAGFEMNEAARFFAILEKQGLSVSRIMPALNASFRNWAAEGKNSREELQKVIDVIRETEDSQKALALATDVFGAQGAQRLTTAIRNGTIPALDELGTYFEGTAGLIQYTSDETKTIGDRFAELKNQAQIGLEPLGAILISLAQEALPPLIEQVSIFAEWMANLDPRVLQVAIGIGAVLAVIGPLLLLISAMIPAVSALGAAIAFLTSPIGLIVAAISGLVAAIIYLWNTNEGFRDAVIAIWEWIKNMAMMIFDAIRAFWDEWGADIIAFFESVWNVVKSIFDAVFGAIRDAVMFIFNEIQAFWDEWGETITEMFRNIFEIVQIVWSTVFEVIKELVQTVFEWIQQFWNTWGEAITAYFEMVFNIVKSIFEGVWNAIKVIVETVTGVISGIIKFFLSALKGDWGAAWEAIKGIVKSVWDGIVGLIKAAANTIIGIANGIIGAIEKMLNFIGDAINKIPRFTVPDWVPGIGGKSFGLPKIPKVNLPRIPTLDVGTNFVERDGLAFLHRGEAVVPKKYNPAAGGVGGNVFNIDVYAQDGTDAGHKIAAVLRRMKI